MVPPLTPRDPPHTVLQRAGKVVAERIEGKATAGFVELPAGLENSGRRDASGVGRFTLQKPYGKDEADLYHRCPEALHHPTRKRGEWILNFALTAAPITMPMTFAMMSSRTGSRCIINNWPVSAGGEIKALVTTANFSENQTVAEM